MPDSKRLRWFSTYKLVEHINTGTGVVHLRPTRRLDSRLLVPINELIHGMSPVYSFTGRRSW